MRLFCLALVLAFIGGPLACAKTVNLDSEQASVDLPETWETKAQPADAGSTSTTLILSGISAEKKSMLQIMVCANPHGLLATDPNLVTNIKDNIPTRSFRTAAR